MSGPLPQGRAAWRGLPGKMNKIDLILVDRQSKNEGTAGRTCVARFVPGLPGDDKECRPARVRIDHTRPRDVLSVHIWEGRRLVYQVRSLVDGIGRHTTAGELIHAMAAFESEHGMSIDLRGLAEHTAQLSLDIEVPCEKSQCLIAPRVVMWCRPAP